MTPATVNLMSKWQITSMEPNEEDSDDDPNVVMHPRLDFMNLEDFEHNLDQSIL